MRIECPNNCGRTVEDWSIDDGKCSSCRAEAARYAAAPREPTWDDVRSLRGLKLAACDWTMVSDRLTPEEKLYWEAYRLKLFNITEDFTTPGEALLFLTQE